VRAVGLVIGVVAAAVFEFLVWQDPSFNWETAKPRGLFGLVIGIPLMLITAPTWLGDWIAKRMFPDQPAE
jgi:hypothetical protein